MPFAGLDIGSRSIELVVLDNGEVKQRATLPTTHNPSAQVHRLLAAIEQCEAICVTGYGRKLAAQELGCSAISEITAYARGARLLNQIVRSVIDIGGQDTKVISLSEAGAVTRFEMNDRCAAGTGRFLEVMALSFQLPIHELGAFAANGNPGIAINSMCAVFAESEVTSLIARGANPADVAYSVHESAAQRTLAMFHRVGAQTPVMFAGGVAYNVCMVKLLTEGVNGEVYVPEYPEYVGALGVAIIASGHKVKREGGA